MSILMHLHISGEHGPFPRVIGLAIAVVMCGSCARIPELELDDSFFYSSEEKIPITREEGEKFTVISTGKSVQIKIKVFPPDSEQLRVYYPSAKGDDYKIEIDSENTYFSIDGKKRPLNLSLDPVLRGGGGTSYMRRFYIARPVPLREFEDKREGWRGGLDDHDYRIHIEFSAGGVRYIADVNYSFDFDYRLDIGVPGGTP